MQQYLANREDLNRSRPSKWTYTIWSIYIEFLYFNNRYFLIFGTNYSYKQLKRCKYLLVNDEQLFLTVGHGYWRFLWGLIYKSRLTFLTDYKRFFRFARLPLLLLINSLHYISFLDKVEIHKVVLQKPYQVVVMVYQGKN